MPRAFVVIIILALVALTPAVGGANTTATEDPRIVGALPNPVAPEDAGEFVLLSVPEGVSNGTMTLSDGESSITLPALRPGTVAITTEPEAVVDRPEPVTGVDGTLSLSNAGENLTLQYDGRQVDTLEYTDAPEGELLDDRPGRDRWHPIGATQLSPIRAGGGHVNAFLLPDAPDVPRDLLSGATERILLGGYTFASTEHTRQLVAAAQRGVDVSVLLDAAPVGGLSRQSATLLDRLIRAGVTVRVLDGPVARYDFYHPKYAVVDDQALVTSENWKSSGIGGAGNRGWGIVSNQTAVVNGLARVFRADAGGRDTATWQNHTVLKRTLESRPPAQGSYPPGRNPATLPVDATRLLVAPDNAEQAVVGAIDNATSSVQVLQVGIGSTNQPFLRATLRAARRGVDVDVLLSGTWYAEADNSHLIAWLREVADREELPLRARLAESGPRFSRVHAKGVVIDGDQALVGSLNWNNNSARDNREVLVDIRGEAVGQYFSEAFRADWEQTGWQLGLGVGLAVLVAALIAIFRARRIRFAAR